MSSFNNLILNEKNAYIYQSTQDPRLNAFNKLLRGIPVESISKLVNDIIKTNDKDMIKDLFVLIFHKRYCRGGEGEKLLSYHLILETYNHYPEIICKLIKLLPLYGYYKDYFEIWKIICELKIDDHTRFSKYQSLISAIVSDIKDQLKKDTDDKISLLAKWMPRENSHYARLCYWYVSSLEKIDLVTYLASIVHNVIPDLKNVKGNKWYLMKYRKLISELSKKLNVSETLMCANKYSEIQYEKVASKAMKNYTKAFLNEKIKSTAPDCDETGNRYPDNKDRVLARNNLKKFILDGKLNQLNGKQLDPHEIIAKFNNPTSSLEKEILYSLWDRKKEDVLQSKKSFGKYIPMIDVSGSMCGGTVEPINVALSLGIMASELSSEPYKDMAISFSEKPTIFKFDKDAKPDQKIEFIKEHHMGFSTQFGKAIDLLLDFCVCNKIPDDQDPSLLVFTDGQFDTMNDCSEDWRTCHKILTDKWIDAGYKECPTIVYWNLRTGTPGFQATSNYPGVQLLQGYSPALMKFILLGEDDEIRNINDIKPIERPTPFETFKKIINQDVYKPILEEFKDIVEYN